MAGLGRLWASGCALLGRLWCACDHLVYGLGYRACIKRPKPTSSVGGRPPGSSGNGTPYHHTSCGSDVSLYSKGRIEAFTTGSPHTNTIVITAEIESGFVAKDDLVPFRCSPVSSCAAKLQTEASMGGRQGQHT